MCNCSRLKYCIANITYILERLVSCCALTSVVTCIMTTLLIMLGIGVGLGYNYCYVDYETGRNAKEDGSTTVKPNVTTVNEMTTSKPYLRIAPTMITSLRKGINFPRLIDEIRKRKNNVTLELVV